MDQEQFGRFMAAQQAMMQNLLQQHAEALSNMCKGEQKQDPPKAETLLTSFENFDPKKENFRNYKMRFENYVDMKGIKANEGLCAKLLLNSIGAKHFNTISALCAPLAPGDKSYEELMVLLEKYLAPKRNTLVAQHQFLSKYQKDNELIAEYVAELRTEIGDCNFTCACTASIADIFLRAQFIRGLKDNSIREKLLQADLTAFNDIVNKAIALETAQLDCKELSQKISTPHSTQHTDTDINKINKGKHQKQAKFQTKLSNIKPKQKPKLNLASLGIDGMCLRCGRSNHLANECRVDRDKLKCHKCKGSGHIEKVCLRTLCENKNDYNRPHSTNQIQDSSINSGRFYVTVNIENVPIQFEVDSGSGYTFLPRKVFKKLNLNRERLLPTSMEFKSYTQNAFVPDGKVLVNAEYNGIAKEEEIYIVPDEYSALLGRTWIRLFSIELLNCINQEINFNSNRSIQSINDNEIFSDFAEIFKPEIGCIPNFKVSLNLREGAKPIFHREREVPYSLITQVDKELQTLEEAGIITRVETSDWGAPLVVIPKANNQVRLCVDYKIGVNERLVGAHYPIRKIEDILNSLRNSKYFCKLDLYKAYLHVPVDEEASKIQTMSTHRGTFKVNRLSFGIKTAPAEFNRIIDQILRDIPCTDAYFDDIIVHGATKNECSANLRKCLAQLRKHDLHVNRHKCDFFQERLEFLGYVIEENKIFKSPSKVEAITKMPRPTSIEGVRNFLGLVTYYAKFIPRASTVTAPLRQLLMKNAKFNWTPKCEATFNQLKEEISNDQVLMPFNPDLELQLACDASPVGIGAVLSHVVNGQERPIAFTSRALTPAEKNYSQLDREALAIVFAVDHFFQYLFGRKFKLITDNQPLARIFHHNSKLPSMTAARLQRYAIFLSGFNYQLICKRGIENGNADCLSRAPINAPHHIEEAINEEVECLCINTVETIANQTLTVDSIREETLKDPTLSKLLFKLKNENELDLDFTVDSDVIFKGQRVVIPSTLQETVLNELHHTHLGITRMKQLSRRYVYWKGIDKDIEQLVRGCANCASVRHSPRKAPLHPWVEPESNWQRIHIDYAGPLQGHQFLIAVDAKSKWAEIETCRNTPTSTSTISLLMGIFARHGFPEVMVLDNATIFTSEEFRTFCKKAGIFLKFSAPGHPATNGLAERNVQTLKNRLNAMADVTIPMHEKVRDILFRYRATPLNDGKSPAEAYLHRNIRIQLDALKPSKSQMNPAPLQRARQLSVGERVQARYYSNNKNLWKPGVVINKYGQLHYRIRLDDGYTLKRHIDQLRSSAVPPHKSEQLTTARSTIDNDDDSVEKQPYEFIYLGDWSNIPDGGHNKQVGVQQKDGDEPVAQSSRREPRPRQLPLRLRNDYVIRYE